MAVNTATELQIMFEAGNMQQQQKITQIIHHPCNLQTFNRQKTHNWQYSGRYSAEKVVTQF